MSTEEYKGVLNDYAFYVKEHIAVSSLDEDHYFSTENMLPNRGGVCRATSLPEQEKAVRVEAGDVLISNIRPYFKKIWLARELAGCSNDVLCIRAKSMCLPEFLFYYLSSDIFFDYVMAGAKGTKMPRGDKQQILHFHMLIPSLDIQKQVISILSCIDKKIQLNAQINQNLEEQAKAIFKSWFVDFEPFQNGKFVDSELGKIPEGWRVGTLNEIADITMGQSPQGASYNENAVGTVFYQGRAEFTDRFPSRRLFTTEPKRMANAGDVLLSVRAPVGDLNIANEPCCIGRGLAAIHAKNGFASFIFYTMQALKTELEKYNGEGTVFGCINKDSLSSQKVIIPPRNIIADFESIASSLDCQYCVDFNENIHLAQLRDTLLPKLMSGEIDVSEVEI